MALLIGSFVATSARAGDQIFAWGDNSAGQCQIPPGLTNVQSIAGGYRHSLALNSNGTVVAWGFNSFGQTNVPAGLTNVAAVAGGFSFSMALLSNGTVSVWGNQPSPPASATNITAVAAGWFHCLALRSNGTVLAWGATSGTATNVPIGLSNVVAVAAGSNVSLALKADGTVLAWGDNSYGQTNVPASVINTIGISAGQAHCVALSRTAAVTVWGGNFDHQFLVPADLTNAVAISAGADHTLALKADGTLEAWGDNSFNQTNVTGGIAGFFSIATGGFHDLAVQGNGAPLILVPPLSQTAFLTETATLNVLAVGAAPMYFQWLRNGTNIPGATNSSLTFGFVTTNNAGSYKVIASNYVATVTSPAAVVMTVGQPPIILIPPQSQLVTCGDTPVLSVTAVGSTPLAYQWRFNGAPIPGATGPSLTLNDFTTNEQGPYSVTITNLYGLTNSPTATLTSGVQPPLITSPLVTNAAQGQLFSYAITALHGPILFGASGLPEGLSINSTSGIISGIPLESGTFGVVLTAVNPCSYDVETLVLNISSSAPVITSSTTANGTEEAPFSYQITATQSPTSFGVDDLPAGLVVDPNSGNISGTPAYAGVFYSTISASNMWGVGTATLQFTFANEQVAGLSIANVQYRYSSPYLLNFQFTLYDNNDPTQGNGLYLDPTNVTATCFEDSNTVNPTDTGIILRRSTLQAFQGYLVLDFADSMASLSNGDNNGNGISDAIDAMVSGSEGFVAQQPAATRQGVFAFWRDDVAPTNIVSLTNNPTVVQNAIAGIWTNHVQGFTSGSRTWDAMTAAVAALGAANSNHQSFIVLASDGQDESSIATLDSVIAAATNDAVEVFCLGLGNQLDPAPLMELASATGGRYYGATNLTDVAGDFDLVSKDINSQYVLRWATLKRSAQSFQPSFSITYQGLTADSPTNIVYTNLNGMPIIDTNATPPTTNFPLATNFIIGPYTPTLFAGSVTTGLLSIASSTEFGQPTDLALTAYYIPRDITQIHLHYRANWPCVVSMLSTNPEELLYGWSLTSAPDGSNGTWLTLSSPNPQSLTTALQFASFGDLLNFSFPDVLFSTNSAFSLMAVDNTIYTNSGGQGFIITNVSAFETVYPTLPFGTPVPWLMSYGFSGNFTNAEVSDPDHDGMLTWQEYRANTNPTNAASKLAITSIAKAADDIRYQITFLTSSDRTYRLLSSTDLLDWQVVQDGIAGVGTPATNVEVTITDTTYYPATTHVFYRVGAY